MSDYSIRLLQPRRFRGPSVNYQRSSVRFYVLHQSIRQECRKKSTESNITVLQSIVSSRRSSQLLQQAPAELEDFACPSRHGLLLVPWRRSWVVVQNLRYRRDGVSTTHLVGMSITVIMLRKIWISTSNSRLKLTKIAQYIWRCFASGCADDEETLETLDVKPEKWAKHDVTRHL